MSEKCRHDTVYYFAIMQSKNKRTHKQKQFSWIDKAKAIGDRHNIDSIVIATKLICK
jgi:hypothetical protein